MNICSLCARKGRGEDSWDKRRRVCLQRFECLTDYDGERELESDLSWVLWSEQLFRKRSDVGKVQSPAVVEIDAADHCSRLGIGDEIVNDELDVPPIELTIAVEVAVWPRREARNDQAGSGRYAFTAMVGCDAS